jgi:hypothetical protein
MYEKREEEINILHQEEKALREKNNLHKKTMNRFHNTIKEELKIESDEKKKLEKQILDAKN